MIGYAYPTVTSPSRALLMKSRAVGFSQTMALQAEIERMRLFGPRPNRQTRRSRRFHDVKRA